MEHYLPYLQWIDTRREFMKELIMKWANINTHAANLAGLEVQMRELKTSFEVLGGEIQELALSPHSIVDEQANRVNMSLGKVLHITKRPEAPLKILLAGHMDTVYGKSSSFQKVVEQDGKLIGPGVCDMKGGLVIMLTALQALEKSPYAKEIGWEILINPDEEIGSPGSHSLYERAAKRNHLGLLFEPAHSDGAIVTKRTGSMKLVVITRGRAAHAGRDFAKGRSAIYAVAPLVVALEELSSVKPGQIEEADFDEQVIVNVGELRSGLGYNVVPDLAILRVNVRASSPERFQTVKSKIEELVATFGKKEGITMELVEELTSPPKVLDRGTDRLIEWLTHCAKLLQFELMGRPSRGASDGNWLSASGLACVDTLGAVGSDIHTHNESIEIDSLTARAKLACLLLMRLGAKEFVIEEESHG